MGIFKLKSDFKPAGDQPEAIKKLVKGIKNGDRFQTLLGVTGSGKTFTMANVISNFDKPILVISPNKALAAQLYREYKNFFPGNSVNYFVSYYDYYQPEAYIPTTDTYIEKEAMINQEIDRLRHKATSALVSRRDVITVASVSCIYNLGVPTSYTKSAIFLEEGKPVSRGDLLRQLVKIQYERTNSVLKRGFFRLRGDVFEIMPAASDTVLRIELKNQLVDGLSIVDALTHHRIEELKEAVIFSSKHFVSSEPQRDAAIKEIRKELKERLEYFEKNGFYLEAERLKRRTLFDLEMLKTIGYCHGIENYSRHLTGKLSGEAPDSLLSYFPKKNGKPDFITIIDESHVAVPQIGGMYEGDQARKQMLTQYGWRLPSALDNRPLKFKEFEERVGQVIFTSATPGVWELKNSTVVAKQVIRPTGLIDPPIVVRPVYDVKNKVSQIDDLEKELNVVVKNDDRAIINALTKKMAEDLSEFLLKKGFKCRWMHSDTKTLERAQIITDFRRGEFNALIGVNLLREGLDFPEVTLVAILDSDREGFLRSETSLIQTMGRASRNVDGKVILYADNITGSMARAIDIVEKRRKVQLAYNKKHNIKPETIRKNIESLIDFN
ncbi:MAG: excinuclease ABC subunit UvrB [bacterium]